MARRTDLREILRLCRRADGDAAGGRRFVTLPRGRPALEPDVRTVHGGKGGNGRIRESTARVPTVIRLRAACRVSILMRSSSGGSRTMEYVKAPVHALASGTSHSSPTPLNASSSTLTASVPECRACRYSIQLTDDATVILRRGVPYAAAVQR